MPDKVDKIIKLNKSFKLPKKGLYKLRSTSDITDYDLVVQSKSEGKTYLTDISLVTPDGIESIVAGTNITVDDTDPANPIISSSGGGSETFQEVLTNGSILTTDNTVDGDTNEFEWNNFDFWNVNLTPLTTTDIEIDFSGIGKVNMLSYTDDADYYGLFLMGLSTVAEKPAIKISGFSDGNVGTGIEQLGAGKIGILQQGYAPETTGGIGVKIEATGEVGVKVITSGLNGEVHQATVTTGNGITFDGTSESGVGAILDGTSETNEGVIISGQTDDGGRRGILISGNNTNGGSSIDIELELINGVLKFTNLPTEENNDIFYTKNSNGFIVESTLATAVGINGIYTINTVAGTTFTVSIPEQADTNYTVQTEANNLLSAVVRYVNNKTTTSFDIVTLSALTGDVSFDWFLKKII